MEESIVQSILLRGEGLTIEFKEASHKLPKTLFDTVCSFLNREGGSILLGIDDLGNVKGIDIEVADKLCTDFANMSNNSELISPPFLLDPKVIDYQGKKLIYVFVPSSSQIHRLKNKVFDRSSDGDFEVTSHVKITELYNKKNNFYSENIIYPYLNESHFEDGIVEKIRKLIRLNRPNHPWLEKEGLEFYKATGLYRTDLMTNTEGFTLASLLLLGKQEFITSTLPHYKIEALLRREDVERYDDRLTIQTNLINAYELLIQFVEKHLSDKFYLENGQRISLRDHIFREVIANFLIHREYINPRVSTFEIFADHCEIRNANKPHLYGSLLPNNYETFPKNPHIAKVFVQIGRAEELGTGIQKIFKYSKLYTGKEPLVDEEDIFEVKIPVLNKTTKETSKETGKETSKETGKETSTSKETGKETTKETGKETSKETSKENQGQLSEYELFIIHEISKNNKITANEISNKMDITEKGVWYHITKLKKKKILERIGATKKGSWKINL